MNAVNELDSLATAIANAGITVQREVPSSSYVTYRIGGPFSIFVQMDSATALERLAAITAESTVPILVLGRGSNLLVADTGFGGLVVQLAGDSMMSIELQGEHVLAGGAAPLPVLARRSVALGRSGLEFFVGIPGSVGGAVHMNAGGHGKETKEVLESAQVCSLRTGAIRSIPNGEFEFGYRRSNLTDTDIVVEATFHSQPDERGGGVDALDEIVRWRREHQPGGANAGSVFKNPPGDSAGRLIEACGGKTIHVGGARISEKHANFISAAPDCRAADVRAVADRAQQLVHEAFGVMLEMELHLVGFERG